MSDAYRKDPDGDALGERKPEPERESDAVSALGPWRDQTRMLAMLAFAVIGIPLAALTWYLVHDYQFAHDDGRALLIVNVGSAAIVWGAMFMIGAAVGRRLVRARATDKLAQLAKDHDVPVAKLQATATMVETL